MEELATLNCAACGRGQPDVRKLIAAGGPSLCDGCIAAYGAALKQALDEDARDRSSSSALIAAEEMALDLIDALEASRAEQADRELFEEIEERTRGLRLVHAEEALAGPEASEPPGPQAPDPGAGRPRDPVRHCPGCAGNLEELADTGPEGPPRYLCSGCARQFEIHEI